MSRAFLDHLAGELAQIEREGLTRHERQIATPQDAVIRVAGGEQVINFCANNYLGLANHPALIAAACEGLERFGFGMASVRFICGTQTLHRELEEGLSAFLGTDDTILYSRGLGLTQQHSKASSTKITVKTAILPPPAALKHKPGAPSLTLSARLGFLTTYSRFYT